MSVKKKEATFVDNIFLLGTDTVNGLEKKKSVHLCVHTVWKYVQSQSEERIDVGLIYLFM